MSVQPTNDALTTRQEISPVKHRPIEGVCAGCHELAQRVERLEDQLAAQNDDVVLPALGTTSCYWFCIAVHAISVFCLFSNGYTVQFGGVAVFGSIGTLMVCHVFCTRSVPMKILRSLLSASVVMTFGILAMWPGMAGPSDLLPTIWLAAPFVFASGWLVAKVFVWSRGWRIIPPGHGSEFPSLQIRHLLLGTFFVAVFLSAGRVLLENNQEMQDLLDLNVLIYVLYVIFPTSVCTLFACVLARIIMLPRSPLVFAHLTMLAFAAFVTHCVSYTLMLTLTGEFSWDSEAIILVLVFSLCTTVGVFASSCFTFLMLGIAKYRFSVPKRSRFSRMIEKKGEDRQLARARAD